MKVLGGYQFEKKKFKFLGFDGIWKDFMGDMPPNFIGVVYGESGEGKSEFCIQFMRYLINFGSLAWLDYEQGHNASLQKAYNRNNTDGQLQKVRFINPLKNRQAGTTMLEELDNYLSKKSTPDFIFINSIDYMRITSAEYYDVLKRHGDKKGIIFISHADGRKPRTKVAKDIEFDGEFGVYVKKYMAYSEKSRLGGRGEYIVWEEEARKRNALYFKKLESE